MPPGTSACDPVWKQGLCRCNEGKNGEASLHSKPRASLGEKSARRVEKETWSLGSPLAPSRGHKQRQRPQKLRGGSRLQVSEGEPSCQHLDLGLLASRTKKVNF